MRFLNIYKILSINITIFLTIIVLIELTSYLVLSRTHLLSGLLKKISLKEIEIDYRVNGPNYKNKDFARRHFRDLKRVKELYFPYTIWKNRPLTTDTINIDETFKRKTFFSKDCSPDCKKIFVFGGSTLFGEGVSDERTIPSYLAKIISGKIKTLNFEVRNYGNRGYQSTQELIRLIMLLERGMVPDLVVFYDGVNDIITSVYNPGIAGYHQKYDFIEQKFNTNSFSSLLMSSKFVELLHLINERFLKRSSKESIADLDNLIKRGVDSYITNLKIVDGLSKRYSFDYYAFLQPTLVTSEKKMTSYEKTYYDESANLQKIYKQSYERINRIDMTNYSFENLSMVFKNVKENIFIDFAHSGDNGNFMVANDIFHKLIPIINKWSQDGKVN